MQNQNDNLSTLEAQSTVPNSSARKTVKCSGKKAFVAGLIAILVIGVVVAGGYYYFKGGKGNSGGNFQETMAKKLNSNVATINGMDVKYNDYADDLAGIKKFYTNAPEGSPTYTDEQLSDQVISRLVANKLIGSLATQYGVTVAKVDLDDAQKKLLASFSDQATAEKEISDRYGWTLPKYMEKVVGPFLLEQKLSQVFTSSSDPALSQYEEEQMHARHILITSTDAKTDAAAKKKAEAILRRVTTGKEDFAVVATEVSEDPGSKVQGGDLGWFGRGAMVPEFETALLKLKSGQITAALVKTKFGYHIIKLEDKKIVKNFFNYVRDMLVKSNITVASFIHNPFVELKKQVDAAAVQAK